MGPQTEQQQQPPASAVPGSLITIPVFGVPVRLHFTFLLLLVFVIVLGLGGRQSNVASVVYIFALFASVLLHELGHVAVSKRYGIKTLEIIMFPIGGLARLERLPKPHEELWIALAGPAVNILIAAAIFAWQGVVGDVNRLRDLLVPTDDNLLHRIAIGNLILAAFNLLPAFPMDGGRVLRAFLARYKSEADATRIAAGAGQMLAIAMGLFGLLSGNFMLVFIAFFVYLGAAQETAAATGKALMASAQVKAAMITDFRTLEHGSSLRDAAQVLLAGSQQDFPIVLGEQVIGLLTRNDLLRGIASEGADAYVSGVMKRQFRKVGPDAELANALGLLDDGCVLVMDEDERLVGLLTRENVMEYLMLRRFGMEPHTA
jgi:Zn-dependent protease/predicted transcriptional regulator